MNIVVCIKQVPDTKGGVKFNPDGTLDRASMLAIMNPDDKVLRQHLESKTRQAQRLQFLQWDFQRLMQSFVRQWLWALMMQF